MIHSGNMSNRVRGRLVSSSRYTRLFPGLLDDVHTPQPMELVSDILVAQPLRLARESGRALVKGVMFRLLGKKGLDKVKDIWASRVGRKLPL